MPKSNFNLYMWVGVVANILLVAYLVYLYFGALPQSTDLIDYQTRNVASVNIYNEKLDIVLNQLRKSENLPINVNPNEIGKENPYGL